MSNLKFGKSKFAKFISGKGFYAALAICVLGAGAAAWVAINRTYNDLSEQSGSGSSYSTEQSGGTDQWGFPQDTQVENKQSGVNVSSAPSSSSAAPSSSSQPSSKQDESSKGSAAQNKSQKILFVSPLDGEVITTFSSGELVKSTTLNEWRTHDGVDITGEAGTPVKATADGTISKIYEDVMWGTTIEVTHANNITSYYMGLNQNVNVKPDQTVSAGDVIGSVGNTAAAEIALDPHIHFAMKQDGKWIDPIAKIDSVKQTNADAE